MLIMRAGSFGAAAFSIKGVTSLVRSKTRWRLRVRTRVQAEDGYSSYGAPQFDPELLTKTCNSRDVP